MSSLSHWLVPEWVSPPSEHLRGVTVSGPLGQQLVAWWLSPGGVRWEADPGHLPFSLQFTWPQARGELGGPGKRLGLGSYGVQSPRHGLEVEVKLPQHPRLCDLWAAAVVWWEAFSGAWGPPFGCLEEPEGQLGPGTWVSQGRQLGRGWGLAWGRRQRRSASSSARTWTAAWQLCLETFPFLVRTENIYLSDRDLQEHQLSYLKNKGSDTRKFAATNHVPPSPFQEKGFVESFWGVGWFQDMSHSSPCMALQ